MDGNGEAEKYPTPLARDICDRLLPEWQALFLRKNAGYGDTHGQLGLRGCFPDVWRKVYRLKAALWDGADTARWSEQPREILLDMIGHLFMILSLLDSEETDVYAAANNPPPDFHFARGANVVAIPLRYEDWEAMPEELRDVVRGIAIRHGVHNV